MFLKEYEITGPNNTPAKCTIRHNYDKKVFSCLIQPKDDGLCDDTYLNIEMDGPAAERRWKIVWWYNNIYRPCKGHLPEETDRVRNQGWGKLVMNTLIQSLFEHYGTPTSIRFDYDKITPFMSDLIKDKWGGTRPSRKPDSESDSPVVVRHIYMLDIDKFLDWNNVDRSTYRPKAGKKKEV